METYFGLTSLAGTTPDATFVGLQDKDGFVLTLMQAKGNQEPIYPDTFHTGFLDQGEPQTHELYQRLKRDGYDVNPPGYYHGKDFYFHTPFGFTIQVS